MSHLFLYTVQSRWKIYVIQFTSRGISKIIKFLVIMSGVDLLLSKVRKIFRKLQYLDLLKKYYYK